MKIKGLIFDFDGLILDTETGEVKIWEEVFNHFGKIFPIDLYFSHIGHATDNNFIFDFMKEIGFSSDQITLAVKKYDELIKTSTYFQTPRTGVKQFIQSGKNDHLSLAVASNSYKDWVIGHLQNLRLDHYFDPICTRDEVSNSKPSPDLYNLVLKKWNFLPQEVIAFEDSPNGVSAAKNAGVFCVAVPNQITVQLEFVDQDLSFNSFDDIDLQNLIRIFEK